MNPDHTDTAIIKILTADSSLTFREIGAQIHLTGQAVGVRINKLVEAGIIEKFTVNVNKAKLGIGSLALIKVYMKTNDHAKMKKLIEETAEIVEAHRISADGCYFLRLESAGNERLNQVLDQINEFANYQLSLSIAKLK